jgi:hypothetical protein
VKPDAPSKPHRIACACGAEPEAFALRQSFKLLAEQVRAWGFANGRQESDAELVGRALREMRGTLDEWRAVPDAMGQNANQPPSAAAAQGRGLRAERDELRRKLSALADEAETLRGEVATQHATLAGWVRRAGDMLDIAAGDGLEWPDAGDPAEWVLEVCEALGGGEWPDVRAKLDPPRGHA